MEEEEEDEEEKDSMIVATALPPIWHDFAWHLHSFHVLALLWHWFGIVFALISYGFSCFGMVLEWLWH